jgi:UDP-N-acetylmuramyl pentapeptide phosphotransferase/UDP-N-acetylglucosamine-1-phosphate transferase
MPLSPGTFWWAALFAAIGAAGTWAARRYALHRNLIDAPGERRSHRVATPRGAGIAIAIALLIAIAALILRLPREIVLLVCAGMGLLLVAGIGWYDDHRPLSPWSRLSVHALASAWAAFGFYLSGSVPLVALAVFVLSLVLINIWNFMDGIDGLAASQATLVAAAFAVWAGSVLSIHLGLALIGSLLGFLPFNFPKARIFLGDVGSGTLGFGVALLAGLALDAAPVAVWPLALLPLSAFLIDAGYTLGARVLGGERWWTPHVSHVYQRWARHAGRHAPVTAGFALWTLMACGLMAWLARGDGTGIAMAVTGCWVVGSVLWLALRRRGGMVKGEEEGA